MQEMKRLLLPQTLLEHTHTTLREIGVNEVEGLVLWAGRQEGATAWVEAVLLPEQQALRTASGLSVHIAGTEIHRINVWLYKKRMELIAQVHSHPGEAYHSELDDAIPITTTAGNLSLVVPDFARGPIDLATYAGYRLSNDGSWVDVSLVSLCQVISEAPDITRS